MAGLSAEQKRCLGLMYKCARKIVHLETNFQFLVKCFEKGFIPKSFRVKNSLPENHKINQEKLNTVSNEAMND